MVPWGHHGCPVNGLAKRDGGGIAGCRYRYRCRILRLAAMARAVGMPMSRHIRLGLGASHPSERAFSRGGQKEYRPPLLHGAARGDAQRRRRKLPATCDGADVGMTLSVIQHEGQAAYDSCCCPVHHEYLCHNYIRHNYMGHDCIGHNRICHAYLCRAWRVSRVRHAWRGVYQVAWAITI